MRNTQNRFVTDVMPSAIIGPIGQHTDDLRDDLLAALQASAELHRDDQPYLAYVFHRNLRERYDLIPRCVSPARSGRSGGIHRVGDRRRVAFPLAR